MDKLTRGLAVTALVLALLAGTAVLKKSNGNAGPQGPKGEQGVQGPVGAPGKNGASADLSALQSVVSGLQELVGKVKLCAIPGRDLPSPNCTNGLCTAVVSGACLDASSTLAIINTPFVNASSTARLAIVDVFSPATSSAMLNLATTTTGSAIASNNATTTGLINRVALPTKSTTTVSSLAKENRNNKGVASSSGEEGYASRAFEVGPRTSVNTLDTLVLSVVARGADSLAGITDGGNLFACKYSVEFVAIDK